MMINIKKYDSSIFEKIKIDFKEFPDLKKIKNINMEDFLKDLERKADLQVFSFNNKPLCIAGALHLTKNTVDLFLIPLNNFKKYKYSLCKKIKQYIDIFFIYGNYGRFQSLCLDTKQYNQWMRFLGFKKDSLLKEYGDNKEDYILWTRYK